MKRLLFFFLMSCFCAAARSQSSENQIMNFRIDDNGVVWVDGIEDPGNFTYWRRPYSVSVPAGTQVIAVKACNGYLQAGILASFSPAGKVSDSQWKCVDVEPRERWQHPEFDDSVWPAAVEKGQNGMHLWGDISNVAPNALWIWTSAAEYPQENDCIYCRVRLEESIKEPKGYIEDPEGNIEDPEENTEDPEGNIEDPDGNIGKGNSDDGHDDDEFMELHKPVIIGLSVTIALVTVGFFFYVFYLCGYRTAKNEMLEKYFDIVWRQNQENNSVDNIAYIEDGKVKINKY